MKRAKSLGSIRLLVYDMESTTETERGYSGHRDMSITGISEKAIKGKAVTSSVQYGPAEKCPPLTVKPKDVYHHPLKLPCAVFEFRYRSRGKPSMHGMLPGIY
jgi:hypothetical protein